MLSLSKPSPLFCFQPKHFAVLLAFCCAAAPSPAPAAESSAPAFSLQLIASNLVQPTVLLQLPGANGKLVVADQIGVAHRLESNGALSNEPFLDLRSKLANLNTNAFDERGLLGLALHPKFSENRRLFVYYSAPLRKGAPADWDHTSHIAEFKVSAGPNPSADISTERILLQIDQPYFNHNGGRLAFGPDGFLYISSGDGGNANDEGRGHSPIGNGQDKTTLLGKILRVDVDSGSPYGIPKDNPFANGGGKPEIYAYGLRNPWGMSFDRGGNRELFASEVGQTLYEEVNIIQRGGNYGWPLCEALIGFDPKNANTPRAEAPKTGASGEPLLQPFVSYKNLNGFKIDPEAIGISVTGGYVYRGKSIPALAGRYVFGDWSAHWAIPRGVLLAASRPSSGSGPWNLEKLLPASHPKALDFYIVAFGEDSDGELYILSNGSNTIGGKRGKVFKLVPAKSS